MEDIHFVMGNSSGSEKKKRTEAISVLAGLFEGHNGVGAADFTADDFMKYMQTEGSDGMPKALARSQKR